MKRTKIDWSKARPVGWAQVWSAAKPAASRNLRKGAWYPILKNSAPAKVILDIGGRPAVVPRSLLRVRPGPVRPDSFGVVCRTRDDLDKAPATHQKLGRVYAVCPECRARQSLYSQEATAECGQCGFQGQVAWWDSG